MTGHVDGVAQPGRPCGTRVALLTPSAGVAVRKWHAVVDRLRGEHPGYSSHEVEKVVQVYFQYHKDMQGGRPVIRYFPSEHFQSIMQFFMQNFSSHHIKRDVEQTSGIFIVPNP